MLHVSADINQVIEAPAPDPDFPCAPPGWTRDDALRTAQAEGLETTEEHWEVIRGLQDYYAHHADATAISLRELHDALDERFHAIGGIKYLYKIFPGGPVAQGCRLAGLKAPFTATDHGFGSVA